MSEREGERERGGGRERERERQRGRDAKTAINLHGDNASQKLTANI